MTKSKTRRVYELYRGVSGPTCKSAAYGGNNKTIWQVAALSLRQAIFLASHNRWFTCAEGVGILSVTGDASDSPWRHHDGTTGRSARYKHYQTF